jgi:hypothetical protein
MALCVSQVTTSSGVFLTPTSTPIASCTDSIILSSTDFATISYFSVSDVSIMAGSVAGVWAVAYGISMLKKLFY